MSARLLALIIEQDVLSERFDHVEMKLERSFTSAEAQAHTKTTIAALAELPVRDRFALVVEIAGDALTIGDLGKQNEVDEHITSYHEDGESIAFRIEIWKEVAQQSLSVYSPAALGAYLDSTPLSEALTALSKRFRDQLLFECYSDVSGRGSETLHFFKAGEAPPEVAAPIAWRHRTLSLLQDNAYRADSTGTLVPRDFAVSEPIGVASLDTFMARAGAALSAMFLSNLSDLRGDQLEYRITGYKLLSGTVSNISELIDDAATFQRIADWAYGAEGNSDKVGLARNVISLCVQRIEEVPSHPEIWDAIQSNYQIYLKENIATYLEVRNKLAELLAESTHKTQSLVERLLDSIRNGVLLVLTFVLTVVVINGLKDTGLKVIFSTEYLAIALVLLALSSLAIWASCRDASSRFDQSAKTTADLLQRMYAHVMISTELNEQVEPTIADNRVYIKKQATKYQRFWFGFASLVALAFLAGHMMFGQNIASDPASNEAEAPIPSIQDCQCPSASPLSAPATPNHSNSSPTVALPSDPTPRKADQRRTSLVDAPPPVQVRGPQVRAPSGVSPHKNSPLESRSEPETADAPTSARPRPV